MGLIDRLFTLLFGSGNVIKETAEVFWENAEAGAARESSVKLATLKQHASEFAQPSQNWYDRLIDGLNRLPRPAMSFGTLGLFIAAMIDPLWFAARMQGLALVPEPLWWLLGAIVSFYFGARHQMKSQEFQRSIAQTMARTKTVAQNIQTLSDLRADYLRAAATTEDAHLTLAALTPGENPALTDWQKVYRI